MSELRSATELAAKRVSRFPNETAEYAAARTALLAEEIEARRYLTKLAEQRMRLPPGPVVEKDYRFRDENGRELALTDLFGKHHTLVTYFWMFGPQRERPCPMCTNFLGGVNGNGADVKQRVAFKILGRSPVERQRAFAIERGWQDLDFVETVGDDYARDLGLLDDKGYEYPAFTVYQKDGNTVRVFTTARCLPRPLIPARIREALSISQPYGIYWT